jgi:triosephosphate isomerase
MRKKIVAGNWKMNTTVAAGKELAKDIVAALGKVPKDVQLIIAPPFTHLAPVADVIKGSAVALSAQNCADKAKGAFTGEVSAEMIAGVGCTYTILGHSERRQYYGETSDTLVAKMALALENGLSPIYCVGEMLSEREAGNHFNVIKAQLEEVLFGLSAEQMAKVVIAYEPVWAIGTGVTATSEQAQEVHAFIRKTLAAKFGELANDITILYGGSCKPSNAKELFACPDIDGGLIGGASLKADDFIAIAMSY